MSISIPGTLNVLERQGRNGAFMVAELETEIGNFDLKHRVLEQFSEGAYEGVFVITRIFNQAVSWKNGTWTKLCAELDWEALKILAQSDDVDAVSDSLAVAQIMAEAQDEAVQHHNQVAKQSATESDSALTSEDEAAVYDRDALSQLIMDGAKHIKLDATMEDRDLFREFRQILRDAGYRFDGRSQSWFFPDAA